MKENSSTSSSRGLRLPLAGISAVIIVIALNLCVTILADRGALPQTEISGAYERVPKDAGKLDVDLLVLGDSRARGILGDALLRDLSDRDTSRIAHIELPGATPRSLLFVLESSDFRTVGPDTIVIVILGMRSMTQNHRVFRQGAIANYFSWPMALRELLLKGRLRDMKFFLGNCSLPLMRHRFKIRKLLPITPLWRKFEMNERLDLIDWNLSDSLDTYQIQALDTLLSELAARTSRVAMVLPAHSQGIRRFFINKNSTYPAEFSERVAQLAQKHGIIFLNYYQEGDLYQFAQDNVHLSDADDSRIRFTKQLAEDLSARFADEAP